MAWLLGLVHTFTEGTDAGRTWFVALILGTAAPALVLLTTRLLRRRQPRLIRDERMRVSLTPHLTNDRELVHVW